MIIYDDTNEILEEIKKEYNEKCELNIYEVYDLEEALKVLREKTLEEGDNGAESVYKVEWKENVWIFWDNQNYDFVLYEDGNWSTYFNDWDEGIDFCLERFCLGREIETAQVEEGYKGEVRVFCYHQDLAAIYDKSGWVRKDDGEMIIFDSYDKAYEEYGDQSDGEFSYYFCKA